MSNKKDKLLLSILLITAIIGGWAYCFNMLTLDEDEILKETRDAYGNVQFEEEPFLKKEKIQHFTDFLFRHIDEIKNYNRHVEFRKIQLANGIWTSHYTNSGDCFEMPTFHESFINKYIPPELTDSLYYYSDGLRNELIAGLSICSKNHPDNIDTTKASVSFTMNCKDKFNANYYLHRSLIQNRKFRLNEKINTVYDYGLTKDTILLNDLKYTIILTPYSGF